MERTPDHEADRRMDAFDAATIAISQELSLERVLQIIVDRVRPLVGARYAALGILDDRGQLERFITAGISEEEQRSIGEQPRGRGLLGVVVRDGHSLRVDDIGADDRSVGFPFGHPPMTTFLGVPVRVEGRAIGRLYLTDKHDGVPFSVDDERLVEAFARHAGLAIHNARMHAQVRGLAVLEERERIAQDLHDGSIQSLYAVSLSLEDTLALLHTEPHQAAQRIDDAIESIHGTIREIREFITGLDGVGPASPELMPAIEALIEEFGRRTLIAARATGDSDLLLEPEASGQLLQLTREALSNVARHAQASGVEVVVTQSNGHLRLGITDDGIGFDTSQPQRHGHRGLTNMRARAESLGGSLTIDSDESGTGVLFEMPLRDRETHKESSV